MSARSWIDVLLFVTIFCYGGGVFTAFPNPIIWAALMFSCALFILVDIVLKRRREHVRPIVTILHAAMILLLVVFGGLVARKLWRDPNLTLRASVAGGFDYIVRWSVGRGADVNGTPNMQSGRPSSLPLEIAIVYRRPRTIHLLLQLGADPNHVDADGEPVAVIAAGSGGSEEMLSDLLHHGMNLNVRSGKDGRTPLQEAIDFHKESSLRFLLDHGADPNLQNDRGETPLMKAACDYTPQASAWVELLLGKGANPAIVDKTGRSALDYARQCNSRKAVELLSHGA